MAINSSRSTASPAPCHATGRDADGSEVDRVREQLRRSVGPDRFERYFSSARFGLGDGTLSLGVRDRFTADLIDRRFGGEIRRAMRECVSDTVELRYRIEHTPKPASPPTAPAAAARPQPGPGRRTRRGRVQLLEDFIVGPSNRVAYATAVRLAQADDAGLFSPLFIHGGCGLGKTHLLNGIAARFKAHKPGAKVVCTTADAFTSAFVSAIRKREMPAFQRKFRGLDLLCLDDAHFLAGKEGTQQELLHTLDALSLDGARLVLASDEHPREVKGLDRALVSRLISGAVVRVDPPDADLRRALVATLATRRGLMLDDSAVLLLADRVSAESGSVRDIEGMLTQLKAFVSLTGADATGLLTASIVAAAMATRRATIAEPRVSGPQRPSSVAQVIKVVCGELAVEIDELKGRGRHKRVVLAREMTVLLCRRMTNRSFPEIAREMGRPNHSSVITMQARVAKRIAEGASVKAACRHDGLGLAELADVLERSVRAADAGRPEPRRHRIA